MTRTWTVRTCDASVNPWRVGFLDPTDGVFTAYWYANAPVAFARKRDALPVVAALNALDVDWSVDARTWPVAQRRILKALLEGTASYQAWERLQARTVSP